MKAAVAATGLPFKRNLQALAIAVAITPEIQTAVVAVATINIQFTKKRVLVTGHPPFYLIKLRNIF